MTRQTRREFLEQSMLAAVAAGTAGSSFIVPAMAADEPSSPNEKIRVAVIGTDVPTNKGQPVGRGQAHLDALMKRQDIEIAAVCDCDEFVGQKTCERVEGQVHKRPAFVRDIRKLLDDKSIHCVTIATPNHWHSLAAIWAIQAGKDVYVEKPVSHNVSEGRRIVDAARKHNRVCQAGTQGRTTGQEFIKFIHEGGIGDVRLARGLCYNRRKSIGDRGEFKVPETVDYNLWAGPAPMAKVTRPQFHYDWHWMWDYGNGDLGNQGIHQMDQCRWGLGLTGLGRGVFSYGGRLGYEDAGETANTQVSVYDYCDKTIVFEVRGLETEPLKGATVGVIFYGTTGYAVSGRGGHKIFDLQGNELRTIGGGERPARTAERSTRPDGNDQHFANFFEAVRSRDAKKLNADIEEGHLSSALCHLGNISYRLGEVTTVPEIQDRLEGCRIVHDECLETLDRFKEHLKANQINLDTAKLRFGAQLAVDGKAETIVGTFASQANPMLTREYRKGFEVPSSAATV